MKSPTNSAATAANINTNPFTRAFDGLSKLFQYNRPWAITLLVLAVLGFWGRSYQSWPSAAGDRSQISFNSSLLLLIVPFSILAILAAVYVNGVVSYLAWKTSRQEAAGFGEALGAVTKRFWTILGVQIITIVKIIGGLLLFVIPGIRAALRYQMVLFPVFEDNADTSAAIQKMKRLTQGHLIEIMGVMTVAAIIPFIGTLLQIGGESILYPQLQQLENYDGPQPKVHWLNYLLPLIIAVAAVFITVLALSYKPLN